MNSTLSTTPTIFFNDSDTVLAESWFVPLDILAIVCLTLAMTLATIYLFIIVLDKTCHTVPMMLTANICLTGCICGSIQLFSTVFVLRNDIKQIQYQDTFCFVIGYLSYAGGALHNYSYVSSAIYRYISIVYSTHVFWQSARVQLLSVGLSWIWAFVLPLLFVFTNTIVYNVDNQVCQVPFRLSLIIAYAPVVIYIVPIHLVIFIYLKLVRYIREMNHHVTPANILSRAQRDFQMVRRIVILVHILLINGLPLSLFIFLSFANRAPKYHFRIGFVFVDLSMLLVMIALFPFTDPLKASVKRILYSRPNMVVPIMARGQSKPNI